MQPLQIRSGLDPDLLDQRGASLPIGLERLGLAPAAVQRQQPLRVNALAQRVIGQQRLDLADDLLVAARGQVRVDRQFGRGQAQLVQPADLRARERLLGDVGQRLAAEQRQGLARGVARRAARRLADQPLEAQRVDQLAVDLQLVAAPARDDLGVAAARRAACADATRSSGPSWPRSPAAPHPTGPRSAGPRRRAGWPRGRASPTPPAASNRPARRGAHQRWPRRIPAGGSPSDDVPRTARRRSSQSPPVRPGNRHCPNSVYRWSTRGAERSQTWRRPA